MYITQEQAQRAIEILKKAQCIFVLLGYKKNDTFSECIGCPFSSWYGCEQNCELVVEIKKLLRETENSDSMAGGKEVITNSDKWRTMPDEQIAEIIMNRGCYCCPVNYKYADCQLAYKRVGPNDFQEHNCKPEIIKWLKQEIDKKPDIKSQQAVKQNKTEETEE